MFWMGRRLMGSGRTWRFQSFFLLTQFRYGPNTCSHYTKVWHRTNPISNAPLSRSARRNFGPLNREIAPQSPFLCVNGSLIRYSFCTVAKAIWYSVNIALSTPTSRVFQNLFALRNCVTTKPLYRLSGTFSCTEVLFTSAEREVKDSRGSGMFQSCLRMS